MRVGYILSIEMIYTLLSIQIVLLTLVVINYYVITHFFLSLGTAS